MIQKERIATYNTQNTKGSYILYWMQSAVRTRYNHALEYSIQKANESGKPLFVVFCLTDSYPEASLRSLQFLHEGLKDVEDNLKRRGIGFQILSGNPGEVIPEVADDATGIITDQGWIRLQRDWRREVIEKAGRQVSVVETNLIVPVHVASEKEEWAARTFRPKISRHLPDFLVPLAPRKLLVPSAGEEPFTGALSGQRISSDSASGHQDGGTFSLTGGENAASRQLTEFLSGKIERYEADRNDPSARATSSLSAYLHFGHISPLEIALRVRENPGPGTNAFLEQLIVRRELSHNFVWYNPRYDQYEGLPAWTRKTLEKHLTDQREYQYTCREFERGETHDRGWNAMQHELVLTGYLHGYLRMYWGKKILEWSESPNEAYRIALSLNNRYELDGRDPNGYTGVAWVFGKHDRPWKERPVFGTIRYMNEAGLRRKFRLDGWVGRVEERYARHQESQSFQSPH